MQSCCLFLAMLAWFWISAVISENTMVLYQIKLLIFRYLHTYILCLSLFLGLPIGFAYRRLIWSAFLCSSFFPFSFGLQTWQIQVPAGWPNTESTVWLGSSIQRTYSTFIWNISFNTKCWRESRQLTMTINYSAQSENPLEKHWVSPLSRKIDFVSVWSAKLCDLYELPAKYSTTVRAPSLQASL